MFKDTHPSVSPEPFDLYGIDYSEELMSTTEWTYSEF